MILADTSIWIDFLAAPGRVPNTRPDLDDLVTCGPVIQEVMQGFADSNLAPIFQKRLLAFPCLSNPIPVELFLNAAALYREGLRKGYTIRSGVDCLIAAIAIENDVPVWHRDRDFTTIAKYSRLKVYPRYVA